jgi:hypothetical protein
VVSGNEPWYIGSRGDSHSMYLPPNSSVVTAPLCIDETYPHFRMFARNVGKADGALRVEVLYYDSKGKVVATKSSDYKTKSPDWQPTGMLGIGVFDSKTTVAAAPVAFRFTPQGNETAYLIDDVYVDPWARH